MRLFYLHKTVKIQPFSPVFPLVGSTAKAFCRLSLWSFKEKASTIFHNTAYFFLFAPSDALGNQDMLGFGEAEGGSEAFGVVGSADDVVQPHGGAEQAHVLVGGTRMHGREKLFAVLDRAWEKHRRNARCLNLELSGELVRLPLYEVRYLDVHQNYVTVHARQDYTVKRTLGEFEAQLDEGFLRVGRGMILNLKQIRRVTKKEVVLADGTALPLPRGAYEPLNRAIIERT